MDVADVSRKGRSNCPEKALEGRALALCDRFNSAVWQIANIPRYGEILRELTGRRAEPDALDTSGEQDRLT